MKTAEEQPVLQQERQEMVRQVVEEVQEEIYENYEQIESNKTKIIQEPATVADDYTTEEVQDFQEDEIVDTGLTAVALYDYQAAADDEISFDPEDIITHVETVSILFTVMFGKLHLLC